MFINPDPDAESFESFIGDFAEQFAKWPLEQRYKAVHVAKIFPTNWKVVQEAFMEAFHVVATHPQLLAGIGDANSQYDWHGNYSRAITPNGTPSPHIRFEPTQQQMFDAMSDRRLDEDPFVVLADDDTARSTAGDGGRVRMADVLGARADELSRRRAVGLDLLHAVPEPPPVGRVQPHHLPVPPVRRPPRHGDHGVHVPRPVAEGEPKPPAVPIHWLGVDDDWTEAPELGMLARVFNQDSFNLPKVQKGLAHCGRTSPWPTTRRRRSATSTTCSRSTSASSRSPPECFVPPGVWCGHAPHQNTRMSIRSSGPGGR